MTLHGTHQSGGSIKMILHTGGDVIVITSTSYNTVIKNGLLNRLKPNEISHLNGEHILKLTDFIVRDLK